MAVTATALRQGYKQMDGQVRCECGEQASRQVWFWQLTHRGGQWNRVQASLVLCEECYRQIRASDPGVSDRPLKGG